MAFDVTRAIPHHVRGLALGMKHLLLTAFLLCSAIFPARADVVIPKPSQLIVSNLSAFPKVKFTVSFGDNAATQTLEENKTYEVRTTARLFVEDLNNKPRIWATVEHQEFNSEAVKIRINEVRRGNKGIEVVHTTVKTPLAPPPRRRPILTTDAGLPFLLAGFGCCGLVLLARRRDSRDEAP
jgi:hypothetical protein